MLQTQHGQTSSQAGSARNGPEVIFLRFSLLALAQHLVCVRLILSLPTAQEGQLKRAGIHQVQGCHIQTLHKPRARKGPGTSWVCASQGCWHCLPTSAISPGLLLHAGQGSASIPAAGRPRGHRSAAHGTEAAVPIRFPNRG